MHCKDVPRVNEGCLISAVVLGSSSSTQAKFDWVAANGTALGLRPACGMMKPEHKPNLRRRFNSLSYCSLISFCFAVFSRGKV